MVVDEVPVCDRCGDQPESLGRLEQHGKALKQTPRRTSTARPNSKFPGRICLSTPLNPISDFQAGDRLKQLDDGPLLPSWMNLLPSNISGSSPPPQHTLMRRRSTFPLCEPANPPTPPRSSPDSSKQGTEDALALATAMQGLSPIPSMQILKGNAKHPYQSLSTSYPSKPLVTNKMPRPDSEETKPRPKLGLSIQPSGSEVEALLPPLTSQRTPSSPSSSSRTSTTAQKRGIGAASRRLSNAMRQPSAVEDHATCVGQPHSLQPNQKIEPARPPFYKELSGFFAKRAGRWILP